MSFKVGQILSSSLSKEQRLVDMQYEINSLSTTNDITVNTFVDKRITLNNGDETSFEEGNYYYLKLIIKRKFPSYDQNLTLKLSNDGSENSSKNYQYIDNFYVFAGTDPQYAVYETIIAPHASYKQINVILARQMVDYYTTKDPTTDEDWENDEENNYQGRIIEILGCQICKIQNVLGTKTKAFSKIGIQGPPGMLMCINGEPIRIGPSGIYEIKNGYKVTFLGFIKKVYDVTVEGNEEVINSDTFIVDYQYEE